VTGSEWKGAAASLLFHGSLVAGTLALSGLTHNVDTAMIIDFSLLPTRTVPGDGPAGAPPEPAGRERPAENAAVAENPSAAAKPLLPVKKPAPPADKPAPLLQEETETAAPMPMPVEPAEETVDDLPQEEEVIAPAATTVAPSPVNTSDATPVSNNGQTAGSTETAPDTHGSPPSGAVSGKGPPSLAGSGEGGDSLSTENPPGTAGAGESPVGEIPASRRDFSFIREKVQRNTRYPRLARRMGLEGQVKVSFTVCHDGKVIDIRIMESSGVSLLDKCAIEAVEKTSPFPSRQLEAKVIIPIVYRLNK
jgi:protein TonB